MNGDPGPGNWGGWINGSPMAQWICDLWLGWLGAL